MSKEDVFNSKQFHIMCYSPSFPTKFIGTNVLTLDNLFEYAEKYFNTTINKIVVVETRQTLYNTNYKPVKKQLDLGFVR